MYWKDPPRANRDAEPRSGAARRYDSYGRVFPVHEHRKTRLVSDLHNEESNLEAKSFKFDAMQLSVSMVIYRIRLFMSLYEGIFSRHD